MKERNPNNIFSLTPLRNICVSRKTDAMAKDVKNQLNDELQLSTFSLQSRENIMSI